MSKRKKNTEEDVALLSTGDVNALEYGGGLLYYQPEYDQFLWTFWDGPDDDDEVEGHTYRVYMFRYASEEDLFSPPHGGLDWARNEIESIASTSGMSEEELRKLGRALPLWKWQAADVVKAHWGPDSIDHSAFELSHAEMKKRYGPDLDNVSHLVDGALMDKYGGPESFDPGKSDGLTTDKAGYTIIRKDRDKATRQLKNKLLR